MERKFVDIALPVPLDHTFTYSVPEELREFAERGKRALVPFGKKLLTGVIIDFPPSTSITSLKPIRDILDEQPTFSKELLDLTRWISDYYLTPWGEVLRSATPQGLFKESTTIVRLLSTNVEEFLSKLKPQARTQKLILSILQKNPVMKMSLLRTQCKGKTLHSSLRELQKQGIVSVDIELERPKVKPKKERTVTITQQGIDAIASGILPDKQLEHLTKLEEESNSGQTAVPLQTFLKKFGFSLSTLRTLEKKQLVSFGEREALRRADEEEPSEQIPSITLNANQDFAVKEIAQALSAETYKAFLLHGVTGSGKTQVYIEAIRKTIERGKTAIALVPEISLTPQTVRRFKAHFGNEVAVTHSQLSAGQRYDVWRMAQEGKIKIVIGPRSVIFTPLKNVGLIVVDEEHESSYKQYDALPRYNARDVALVRAHQANAVVVLGSATPSIESYYNAQQKKYTLLTLPQRVDKAQLPAIELVDMRTERKQQYEDTKEEIQKSGKPFPKHLPPTSISKLLQDHIQRRLDAKEGIILMQNRRGFSHVMECYDCGYVEKCDNCDVTLTYHVIKKHLRCHYCGFVKKPPTVCPQCQGTELRFHAFGTQQVHEELQQLFPDAKIVRMDRDTTTRKGSHHKILNSFESGEADILLGTQMVAKGLDFPRVTLVGVISADTQMLLPDFRSAEVTFQLLTQVAGRAGRSTIAGEVVIQTLQPEHYTLKHVLNQNYLAFYLEELQYRKELDYPPFSRLALIEFVGADEPHVQRHARVFAQYLNALNHNSYRVLGPADAAIPKIRNQYRKHIVVKSLKQLDSNGTHLRHALRKAQEQYANSSLTEKSNIKVIIDIDPQGMM